MIIEDPISVVFTWVFCALALIVVLILAVVFWVQKLPFVPNFITLGETANNQYSFSFAAVREIPYLTAFTLSNFVLGDRNFLEHAVEASYYNSIEYSGSGALAASPIGKNPVYNYLLGTNIYLGLPWNIKLDAFFSLTKDVETFSIEIPLLYRNELSRMKVSIAK